MTMLKNELPRIVTKQIPGPKAAKWIARRGEAVPSAIKCVYPIVIARGEGAMLEDVDGNYFLDWVGGVGVPLRYNNDKQKKPLFSRGLSVCRLLFNSFSKLKIDENYKEKRRLFY